MTEEAISEEESEEADMHLFDHIGELRQRLIYCFTSIGLLSCISFVYSSQAFQVLSEPFFNAFSQDVLIGTGPAEAFLLRIKVAIFLGCIFSSPVIFFQIWQFIAPGLYQHERKLVLPFVLVTTLLFGGGVYFAYEVLLPYAFDFFKSQYTTIGVTPTIRISEHLSLLLKALLGAGIVFEMPVMAFLLGRLGVIDHKIMISGGRYAIVLIFLMSAILTPPDIFTQFLMAGPLLGLYGISIWIVKLTGRKPLDAEEVSPPQTAL
jgi:sec-independent protein translocase protein TatC